MYYINIEIKRGTITTNNDYMFLAEIMHNYLRPTIVELKSEPKFHFGHTFFKIFYFFQVFKIYVWLENSRP